MGNTPEIITLDVRGEICPVPLLKAIEAMSGALHGQAIEMLTDFMPAILVVTNAALKEGWDVSVQHMSSSEWRILLTQTGSIVSGV